MKRQPTTPVPQKKPRKAVLNYFPFIVDSSESYVFISLPIKTVSEANNFDHYMTKHKRQKTQKKLVRLALTQVKCQITLPCTITLSRYASKTLDKHDNLPMSFKYILDELCFFITGKDRGRGDDDERISMSYEQVLSRNYGIKIKINFNELA